ncbi:MAG: GTPase HflX [Oligoflexales bacterium]
MVGVLLPGKSEEILRADLEELEALLCTLEIPVSQRIIQRRVKLSPRCLVGSGKVDEIRALCENTRSEVVVFDHPLTPPQIRNLEEMTGKTVIDRTGVILEIFSRHARTNQAKTQVEIAKLEYMLPRLTGAWTHLSRQTGGGVNARGMGETQIEIDRRRARERIARLQSKLKHFETERMTQRRARQSELKVALVGYTNSGKTTVMKGLTRSIVKPEDKLFATLDANIKKIDPTSKPRILISDTVGFIRNLPHGLIESFKSTLDEVKEADVLIHVVDASQENFADQMDITKHVLEDIGAQHIPVITVFNKADLVEDSVFLRVLKKTYPGSLVVAAESKDGIEAIRQAVQRFFEEKFVTFFVAVKNSDSTVLSDIYNSCRIVETDYSQHGKVIFELQSTPEVRARFMPLTIDKPVFEKLVIND